MHHSESSPARPLPGPPPSARPGPPGLPGLPPGARGTRPGPVPPTPGPAPQDAPPEAAEATDPAEAAAGHGTGGAGEADLADEAPGAPRPMGIELRSTGHAPVDALLGRLADVSQLGVDAHLEVYEDVHRGLRETLSALDRPTPRS